MDYEVWRVGRVSPTANHELSKQLDAYDERRKAQATEKRPTERQLPT
ncbi:hypothetical protein GCM10023205_40590 [Yinghuangia aomiensis]|uniref:Uncharacterized protein n=1 Tax=Yinghuangia aomiensis TaxID=676205 RepID=A0ABP9HHH6_9ACTN